MTYTAYTPLIFLLLTSCLNNFVSGHAYIKHWSADGGKEELAQKQPLSNTAFRGVSSNTGWIGSKFIETGAITCGASETPKGKVSSPIEPFFHTADQSAKKTLSVKAGGKIDLLLSGEPGKGFPHPNGHIQTYLGFCGAGSNACVDFDASKAKYFKIQAEINAIADKLRPNFDHEADGNKWEVPIPEFIPPGSYVMRLELITFDQSSEEEGKQDQYYVYCGQIYVTGSKTSASTLAQFDTVQFPGAYKAGNRDKSTLPGPSMVSNVSPSQSKDKSSSADEPAADDSQDSTGDGPAAKDSQESTGDDSAPEDNQESTDEEPATEDEQKSTGDEPAPEDNQESTDEEPATEDGQKSTGDEPAAEDNHKPTDDQPAAEDSHKANGDEPAGRVDDGANSKKLTACDGTCFKAKTTAQELKHLAPTCSPDDLTCLCRSHKFVCAYVSCATSNCKGENAAKEATDEVYSKCGAIVAYPSRLPTTDYVPDHQNPSLAEKSKSKSCMDKCFGDGNKLGGSSCAPGNLDCVCKDHAAVCAWAKCAETNCQDNTDTIRLASDAIYDKCNAITHSSVRRQRR